MSVYIICQGSTVPIGSKECLNDFVRHISIGQEDIDVCLAYVGKLKGIVHEIIKRVLQEFLQSGIALNLAPTDRMFLSIKANLYIILFAMVVDRFDLLGRHIIIENVAIYILGLGRQLEIQWMLG